MRGWAVGHVWLSLRASFQRGTLPLSPADSTPSRGAREPLIHWCAEVNGSRAILTFGAAAPACKAIQLSNRHGLQTPQAMKIENLSYSQQYSVCQRSNPSPGPPGRHFRSKNRSFARRTASGFRMRAPGGKTAQPHARKTAQAVGPWGHSQCILECDRRMASSQGFDVV
jgi:hypothetical protein